MEQIIREAYRMYFKDEITFLQLVGIINKTYYSHGQKHIFLVTPASELRLLTNLFKSFLRRVNE